MEEIKILFFALTSFFGIEDARFAADKVTITIHPEKQEIEIIQENLFAVIQSEKDSIMVVEQWNKIRNRNESQTIWANELDSFHSKSFKLIDVENTIQPHILLKYSSNEDLSVMGIWYNAENNQYAINNIPQQNIKTNSGKLNGNYWYFDAASTFSFTEEPFSDMPENYRKLKIPLKELLKKK
ncbi:hypothetical protein FFWV33_08245 [Flavobacterium faecale]|uniref:Uncharacterized protein n=1 Tax=Flavobacterium faecale TaxID=1355330 RepID=A0A2S1LCM9_9FLAO|nr:hypothetical protein [Flavobacterium faecale]AWG21520.1 hypothetical protein FFWV33_08245 [Flavobacterium faecale]